MVHGLKKSMLLVFGLYVAVFVAINVKPNSDRLGLDSGATSPAVLLPTHSNFLGSWPCAENHCLAALCDRKSLLIPEGWTILGYYCS